MLLCLIILLWKWDPSQLTTNSMVLSYVILIADMLVGMLQNSWWIPTSLSMIMTTIITVTFYYIEYDYFDIGTFSIMGFIIVMLIYATY